MRYGHICKCLMFFFKKKTTFELLLQTHYNLKPLDLNYSRHRLTITEKFDLYVYKIFQFFDRVKVIDYSKFFKRGDIVDFFVQIGISFFCVLNAKSFLLRNTDLLFKIVSFYIFTFS